MNGRRWHADPTWHALDGVNYQITRGRYQRGDLLLHIVTRRPVVPTMHLVAFLLDYMADNERHNRPDESGDGFLRQFAEIAIRDGHEAAHEWDKARRRGRR